MVSSALICFSSLRLPSRHPIITGPPFPLREMAVPSLSSFSLFSHYYVNPTPKTPYPTIKNPFKTHFLNSSSPLYFHPKLRRPIGEFLISSKPTSKPSILAFLSPTQKAASKYFVEKIATLLLGSLIFMGLKSRPVLAQPVQESETFEEKSDAQSSDNEDEEMCVKLLQENPKSIDSLKMVVNVKMRRGKTNEAVECVEKLIELQPNEMEWRLLQALCYEMMGNLSKAKGLFKNILKQKPLLLRALHGLAMVMHKNHEGLAVFEMLERALEIAHREKKVNEERNIRILIAQMHLVKGDLEEALTKFQALIDENPRDFRPYLCQGIVYSLLDEKQKAEESFEIYRSLVPDEFSQRGFLDDVVLAAKTESKQKLEEELQ